MKSSQPIIRGHVAMRETKRELLLHFFLLRRAVSVGEESRLKNGGFLEREGATSL